MYYLLAMVLFFQSGRRGEAGWDKLVAGLEWARRFRVRTSLGMRPTQAAVTYARQRLGLAGDGAADGGAGGRRRWPGRSRNPVFVAGMRLVAVDGLCRDAPATPENGDEFGYPGNDSGPWAASRTSCAAGIGECGTRAALVAGMSRRRPGSSR